MIKKPRQPRARGENNFRMRNKLSLVKHTSNKIVEVGVEYNVSPAVCVKNGGKNASWIISTKLRLIDASYSFWKSRSSALYIHVHESEKIRVGILLVK